MAKTNTSSTTNEKVVHQVEYVNLQDFGYEKSGNVKGDPTIYASYLDRILNGDLVDDKSSGISDDEKDAKREKLKEIESALDDAVKQNKKINAEIKEKQDKVDARREELLQIHERHDKDPEAMKQESFSPLKFSINVFFLLFLSGYLFFFYVSTAYRALYTDLEQIAEGIAAGVGTGSIMPRPVELAEALQFNYLLLLVPFVFYAFGWAFHILLELKNKYKFIYLGLLMAVTFVVDLLLAMLIHNNNESAKDLMGLETKSWLADPGFFMILFLGFMVYVLWSILLDSMFREWAKYSVLANIKKIIKHQKGDIKNLEAKLIPEEPIREDIYNIREDLGTVIHGNLKSYVDQFTNGWISYLSPQNLKEVKTKCLTIKKDFESKHQIKSGIVKVLKRRAF